MSTITMNSVIWCGDPSSILLIKGGCMLGTSTKLNLTIRNTYGNNVVWTLDLLDSAIHVQVFIYCPSG